MSAFSTNPIFLDYGQKCQLTYTPARVYKVDYCTIAKFLLQDQPMPSSESHRHELVQTIGYVGMPSLDVLSVVFGAHKNGAALPYTK